MNKPGAVAFAFLLPLTFAGAARAKAQVWAIDDGEKIKQDATALPFAKGTDNPVWAPGAPIRLFALRNETVAFQVVVTADKSALDGVTVDVSDLTGPCGQVLGNAPGATDPTRSVGRRIERFVEHFFDITRPSGGKDPAESLGWVAGSGPTTGAWTGLVPDALIPVEAAPAWDPYPMHVDANRNGVVWVDVTVPKGQAAGKYTGTVQVASGGKTLGTLPLELEIDAPVMPDGPSPTMLYYDPSELQRRIGSTDAEAAYWQLLHRHRIAPMHQAIVASDLTPQLPALDGSEYTAAHGYEGPGEGVGDGIVVLGAYGGYGAPGATALGEVEGIADLLAGHGLFSSTTAFVYAIDETCDSTYGADWKTLLAGSSDPAARNVRVGWTCSDDPSTQPVDIPIVWAANYDPAAAARATAAGKQVWTYNGQRPETDAFLTDTSAIALRANEWIAASANIPRWFYWESTFWYDDNHGGKGAYDPFVSAETCHNADGDWAEGDGVLVYPGKQVDVFTEHSVGIDGVLPSIRLKNWRRGVEDAAYVTLARAVNPARTSATVAALLPRVLSSAVDGNPVSWPEHGLPWFAARKALRDVFTSAPATSNRCP